MYVFKETDKKAFLIQENPRVPVSTGRGSAPFTVSPGSARLSCASVRFLLKLLGEERILFHQLIMSLSQRQEFLFPRRWGLHARGHSREAASLLEALTVINLTAPSPHPPNSHR